MNNRVNVWLILCAFLIIFVIIIGGYTRLLGAGLSIVEWKPIRGIIPPLTEISWQEEFNKYQTSPEFKLYNFDIDLSYFKKIYWLEYFHRLAARLIGLVYFVPLIWFRVHRKIKLNIYYLVAAFLLTGQGYIGWYMVKSGLNKDPSISHYRLALHLINAIFIYSLLLWQLLKNVYVSDKHRRCNNHLYISALILLYGQIILGAFVAGLKAGHIYNQFPLMGDSFIPPELHIYHNISFKSPVFVQFVHRCGAYLLIINILIIAYSLIKSINYRSKYIGVGLLLVLFTQFYLGVLNILLDVPLNLAILHQLDAVLLLSFLLTARAIDNKYNDTK